MRNDKIVGTALYVELRKGGYTAQYLFTPEVVHSGKVVPANLRNRTVSASTPRKPWSPRPATTVSSLEEIQSGDMELGDAVSSAITRIEPFLGYLQNHVEADWKLYKEPLAVQMTPMDAEALYNKATPEALLSRVMKARLEAGYSDNLWDLTA